MFMQHCIISVDQRQDIDSLAANSECMLKFDRTLRVYCKLYFGVGLLCRRLTKHMIKIKEELLRFVGGRGYVFA